MVPTDLDLQYVFLVHKSTFGGFIVKILLPEFEDTEKSNCLMPKKTWNAYSPPIEYIAEPNGTFNPNKTIEE